LNDAVAEGKTMGLVYRLLLRPLLVLQDSERAHTRSVRSLRLLTSNRVTKYLISLVYKTRKTLPVTLFGTEYKHPFGLAAGMDKKGEAINGWDSLGLSFVEIGGVTMLEQTGNPKPRMFRSTSNKALINRMGFNNPGSENMHENLTKHFDKYGKPKIPIWVNLGKSKLTENADAHIDYSTTLGKLWEFTDVFVINVSSPNTPNLRDLQGEEELKKIINSCLEVNESKSMDYQLPPKPILIKIAPDMTFEQLEQIITVAMDSGCAGVVATNTTVSRDFDLVEDAKLGEKGGLSGLPLKTTSTEFIKHIYRFTDGKFPIIGVGGIMDADDAWEKITAGASLIQAYSGFVFEGPSLASSIVRGLDRKLRDSGIKDLEQAVGLIHKESN